jgi:hypothetical protein
MMPVLGRTLAALAGGAGGGGGVTLAAANPLSTWSTADPSSIGNGVSAGSGGGIDIAIDTPATVSGTPDAMYCVYGSLDAVDGEASATLDQHALWQQWMICLTTIAAAYADMHAIICVYNDGSTGGTQGPQSTTEGIGFGLLYTAGEWQVTVHTNAGAGWGYTGTPGAGTNADTEGVRGGTFAAQSGSATRSAAFGVDAAGAPTSGTNQATSDRAVNIGDGPFNSIAMGIGWETGTGGSAGTLELHGAVIALDALASVTGVLP